MLTGDHKSVASRRLLRQGEHESENAADNVESLQRVSDRCRDAANSSVRSTVGGDDVGVKIDGVDVDSVHSTRNLTTDTLSFVCKLMKI